MEVVLPHGWSEVASRRDVEVLEQRTALRFDAVDARFASLERHWARRFDSLQRHWDDRVALVAQRLDGIEGRMVDRAELQRDLRHLFGAVLAANAAVAGLALGVAGLLG